jgi:hypothetical protein
MQRWPVKIGEVSFCNWRECRGCESHSNFTERVSTQWLQDFKLNPFIMGQLRIMARTQDFGQDLSRMNDDEVIAQIQHLIERRGLRRCGKPLDETAKPFSARDQKRNATEAVILVLAGRDGKHSVGGHAYRIIRAGQWRNLREEGGYRIVQIAEARQIIEQLAATPAIAPASKAAWAKAAELLSESGMGRFDDGLLLLRIVPRRNFKSPSSEPPITPSQFAQMVKEKHWVAIELVDEEGNGVEGVSYSIIAPDNQEYTGRTDATGSARLDNIPAGQCKISFPDLDKDAYKAA